MPEDRSDSALAALYIRVSTDRQEELSPDAQKRLLLDYAKAHGLYAPEEYTFIENGISGKKADKRPQFQKMIGLAKSKPKPFSLILVWKFSRFARNQEESIVYKSMLKKQCGIDVISITEPLMEGPFGSLIERIIEWMDEYYSINLSGEVIRGMTEKAMRGGYQSAPSLGYASPGPGLPFVVVPEEAETVRYIFEQYVQNRRDPTAIARSLNERQIRTKRGNPFERRSVTYILKNKFYTGKLLWNGIERDGAHEALISEELFREASDRLNAGLSQERRRSVASCKHWLSGLVKCSVCGATLTYNHCREKYFNCWKYAKGLHPGGSYISQRQLESGVQSYFEKLLNDREFHFACHTVSPRQAADAAMLYQKDLKKISARERRIKEAYEAGIDSLEEYGEKKQRLRTQRRQLEQLVRCAEPAACDEKPDCNMSSAIRTVYDLLNDETIDYEVKGAFIRAVLEKIIWNRAENTLTFYLRPPESP